MPAYMVRLNDECGKHARDLVGIFVAESMEQLFWLVDEAASPDECECMELGSGGIYWDENGTPKAPRDAEPDWDTMPDDWRLLPSAPSLTDHWEGMFTAGSEAADDVWMPIVWAHDDEEDGPPEPPPSKGQRSSAGNVVPFKRGGRPG